jgi:hypothetical protein
VIVGQIGMNVDIQQIVGQMTLNKDQHGKIRPVQYLGDIRQTEIHSAIDKGIHDTATKSQIEIIDR